MVIKGRTAEFRKSGAVSPGPAHRTGGTEGAKTAYHVAIKLGSVRVTQVVLTLKAGRSWRLAETRCCVGRVGVPEERTGKAVGKGAAQLQQRC